MISQSVSQSEICILVKNLRSGLISKPDFEKFFNLLMQRSRVNGDLKRDVAMIAIESIRQSKTEVTEENANVYLYCRLSDAKYDAGISKYNPSKVPVQHRLNIIRLPDELDYIDSSLEEFQKIEKNIDFKR
jgi:hypothetical protein